MAVASLAGSLRSPLGTVLFGYHLPGNARAAEPRGLFKADTGDGVEGFSFDEVVPDLTLANVGEGVELQEGLAVVRAEGAEVTYELAGIPAAETYVEFVNLRYADLPAERSELETLPERISYVRNAYLRTERLSASVRVRRQDGRSNSYPLLSYKSHMYGGKDSGLVYLGYWDEPVTSVTVDFSAPGLYSFDAIRVVQQPMDALAGLVEECRADPVTVIESVNGYDADVAMGSAKYLFVSVPYSTGWSASVGGEEAEVHKADEGFMAVTVPKGHHTVRLRYVTPLLREGFALTLAAIVASVLVTRRMGAAQLDG